MYKEHAALQSTAPSTSRHRSARWRRSTRAQARRFGSTTRRKLRRRAAPANAGFQQRGLEYWRGEIDGEGRRAFDLRRAPPPPDLARQNDRPARSGLRRRRHGEHPPSAWAARSTSASTPHSAPPNRLRRRHRAGLGHLGRSARTEDAARPRPRLRRADRGDALDSFTRFRGPASSATRPGSTDPGSTPGTRTCGR